MSWRKRRAAPQPDGRRLRLGSDSLEVYIIRIGQPQRTGYLIDRLDTVRVNGETMLRRIYRTTDTVLGSSVDTLVDVLTTLQPRSVWSRSNRGTERLDWQTNRVVGVVEEPDAPARSIDSPRPTGWYSSASFDLILRASPLAEGYRISVPSFSGLQGSHVLTANVAASEPVEGAGDTWRIEADFAGPSGDVLDRQDLASGGTTDHARLPDGEDHVRRSTQRVVRVSL